MPLLPVILITDGLLWFLVGAAVCYAWYCQRKPHLAAPWKRVFQSKAAIVCAVLLLAYLGIGLADSVHFRLRLQQVQGATQTAYSPEVLSLLDVALARLRSQQEKTYSAPLATRLYAKEQVEMPDGKLVREFPRLRFGGAQLKDEADWWLDVGGSILLGMFAAAVAGGILSMLAKGLERRRP